MAVRDLVIVTIVVCRSHWTLITMMSNWQGWSARSIFIYPGLLINGVEWDPFRFGVSTTLVNGVSVLHTIKRSVLPDSLMDARGMFRCWCQEGGPTWCKYATGMHVELCSSWDPKRKMQRGRNSVRKWNPTTVLVTQDILANHMKLPTMQSPGLQEPKRGGAD